MKLSLVLAALAASVAGVSAQMSLCAKYATTSASLPQLALVNDIVTRAALGGSGMSVTVEGLVVNAYTKGFFNGMNPSYRNPTYMLNANAYPGTMLPDFTLPANNASLAALGAHLNGFFGAALQCNMTAFPSAGHSDQYQIHSSMPINQTVFTAFITQVANSAMSYGMTVADVTAVGGALAAYQKSTITANNICNQDACDCAPGFSGPPTCAATAAAGSSTAGAPAGTGAGGAASSVQVSLAATLMAAVGAVFAMRR